MHPGRRAAATMVLLVLGLAAAALALFAMTLIDARFLVFCGTTDADVADMRTWSVSLLLSAATQALAATLALLVPKRALTVLACVLGSRTCQHANDVIYRVLDCHSHVHGALALQYWLFLAVEFAAFLSGIGIALFGEEIIIS